MATPMRELVAVGGADRPTHTDIEVVIGSEEAPVLVHWNSLCENRGLGGHDSYALRTPDGLVLVDPDGAADTPYEPPQVRLAALLSRMGGDPIATLLTYTFHERSAMRLRDRFGVPVWAPRGGDAVLDEGMPDHRYDDGARLPGGVRAITIRVDGPQAEPTGESFLLWETPDPSRSGRQRVLFAYDRIVPRVRSNDPAMVPLRAYRGPIVWFTRSWLPDGPTEVQLARSRHLTSAMRRLLSEEFDLICPGHHQEVMRDDPKAALARVLEHGRPLVGGRFIALPPT